VWFAQKGSSHSIQVKPPARTVLRVNTATSRDSQAASLAQEGSTRQVVPQQLVLSPAIGVLLVLGQMLVSVSSALPGST
jgi:hypothetical protein